MAIHKINGDGFLSDISQSGHLGMNKQSPTTERGGGGGNSWVQGLTIFANALLTVCAQLHTTFTKGTNSILKTMSEG